MKEVIEYLSRPYATSFVISTQKLLTYHS